MAVALNKNRMLVSRLLFVFAFFMAFFTSSVIPEGSILEEGIELIAYMLIIGCAFGRVYCTAFIGGMKNQHLITEGPYSICRNPLYFCSLLGVAGLGLLTIQGMTFAIVFLGFLWVYDRLISREEAHLAEKFGADFVAYKKRVPRLFPNFSKFRISGEALFQPKYLTYAVRDAVWWFALVPLVEFARYLQTVGVIKPLFTVF